MYSMVLMAALTTGTDMPDWWGRRGGWGCHGCYGGYARGGYGCYGYGCYGYGCYGYGCYGWGGYARGWGGGYGWGGYGYGGWGGWGGWGYAYSPVYSGYDTPVIVSNTLSNDPALTRSLYYDPASATNGMTRATIIVHLPADAKLIVDGKRTQSTSATRRFVSPPLEEDKGYHYIFKAERTRDGETIATTQKVEVRAGETRQVYLKFANRDQTVERVHTPAQPAERKGVPRPEKARLPDEP